MDIFLIKAKTKNLKLYSERCNKLFERPKFMHFIDGGIETYGIEFSICKVYFYLHSERYYKTWLD